MNSPRPCSESNSTFVVTCKGNQAVRGRGGYVPDYKHCKGPEYSLNLANIPITIGTSSPQSAADFQSRVIGEPKAKPDADCKYVYYAGPQTFDTQGVTIIGLPSAFACNLQAGDAAAENGDFYVSDGDNSTTDGINGHDQRFPVAPFDPLTFENGSLVCLAAADDSNKLCFPPNECESPTSSSDSADPIDFAQDIVDTTLWTKADIPDGYSLV